MAGEAQVRELNTEERAAFDAGLALIRRFAMELGTPLSIDGDETDIPVLQQMIDQHLQWPKDDKAAIGIGLAFGLAVAKDNGLEWVRITDEFGSETSLSLPGTTLWIHPISMVTRRLEKQQKVDLQDLYATLLDRIPQLARQFEEK